MARKRGGQRKHWAEQARVWVWYREIKRRCDWSDYQLDQAFAWTEEGQANRSTDHRPRTFEWIRKSARKPAGRDQRWRNMSALVAAVEQHPLFQGTQALYDAEFWDLLQAPTLTPDNVQMRIDRILGVNGLVRIDPPKVPAIAAMVAKHGNEPVFDRCLRRSLNGMDSLSGMALVWLLYLQTEPAHNWPIRAVIETIADKLLDDFFGGYFPLPAHFEYYTNSVQTLLQARLDMSERQIHGYGYLEVVGIWPILPEELSGSISENDLFYPV